MVITPSLAAWLSKDEQAMDFWGTDRTDCEQDKKLAAIGEFLEVNAYEEVFANEAFVVYE